ncbi:MAG: GatB/YqeY domain-containing protein [Candidatus Lambdaproteobacteria bacterium]|nr:GatB/YqeY domain-containing protein [Candidatus Lambdaproteobacteria bacterium]
MLDLDAAIKTALKSKDATALAAYRALKTKVMVKLTEAGREGHRPLSDEELHALLRKEIKERHESNEFLDPAGETYRTNAGIVAILDAHLPKLLSAEQADALIRQVIAATGAAGPRDLGNVMKALRDSGQPLDMKAVSTRVKELLAG